MFKLEPHILETTEEYNLSEFLLYLSKEFNNYNGIGRKTEIATGLELINQFLDDRMDSITKDK